MQKKQSGVTVIGMIHNRPGKLSHGSSTFKGHQKSRLLATVPSRGRSCHDIDYGNLSWLWGAVLRARCLPLPQGEWQVVLPTTNFP